MTITHASRMIAFARLIFALEAVGFAVFLPLSSIAGMQFVLALAYLGWSSALAACALRSWWLDCRLAAPAQIVDIAGFAFVTWADHRLGGGHPDAFVGFGLFVVLTGLVRWHRRGLLTCAALVAVIELATLGAVAPDLTSRVLILAGRDVSDVAVIVAMVGWMIAAQQDNTARELPEPPGLPGERRQGLIADALTTVREVLGAEGAAMAMMQGEEPWVDLMVDRGGVRTVDRCGPASFEEALAVCPSACLFDTRRHRVVARLGPHQIGVATTTAPPRLAALCQIEVGLLVPIRCASGSGQLLVWGRRTADVDVLLRAEALARRIGEAFDREDMAALARSSAVAEVRDALARDLHDSVVQFLAGTLFRLEALRRRLRDGMDPEDEIVAMKDALRREQAQMRVMIDRLRRGEDGDRATDLIEEFRSLLDEMAHHWHIDVKLAAGSQTMPVPIHLAYELRQLVREAIANAVRHGHARQVTLAVDESAEQLDIAIVDDGRGLPADPASAEDIYRPRSISERVAALGGRVKISDRASDGQEVSGVRLDIGIPARISR